MTKKITVLRLISDNDATLSAVFVDGWFRKFGLEDEHRDVKVAGETRIPAGIYKVKVRTFGGHHQRYSQMFPDFHKGMLEVCDVPGFTDILIHIGNYERDTEGCLLVGEDANTGEKLYIPDSKDAYVSLYKEVIDAALNDDLFIEYLDADRSPILKFLLCS